MLIFKIAWRNLMRHKGKSIIIGTILFLGAFIMTLGNATAIGMQRGVDENMVRSFTGHIIIVSAEETKENVLFTPMAKPLKVLPQYDRLKGLLADQEYIRDFLPMTRGGVMILGGDMAQTSYLLTFGCNFSDYQRVFGQTMTPIEGRLLENGEHGILINKKSRENLHKFQGFWLVPEGSELDRENLTEDAKKELDLLDVRHSLMLGGFGEKNSSDKEVAVRGIVRFKSLNSLMAEISLMDIETYRELFGYYTAKDVVEELPVEQEKLIEAGEDDFFGSDDIYSSGSTGTSIAAIERQIRTETKITRVINYDSAAFNYVTILLQSGQDMYQAQKKLQALMKEFNLPVKVLTWKQASGQVAAIADILQTIILVFVILLFLVAVIIIMNTLSMTAMERTEEFGMMRAVGARKSFITKMFLSETFSLSFMFGGFGIFLGIIVTWIIRPLEISSGGNEIFELLFGGEVFRPILGGLGLVYAILSLGIVTVLAVILPVFVARKITPLDAINRH